MALRRVKSFLIHPVVHLFVYLFLSMLITMGLSYPLAICLEKFFMNRKNKMENKTAYFFNNRSNPLTV